jgi:CRP-like cAMP-binding protein
MIRETTLSLLVSYSVGKLTYDFLSPDPKAHDARTCEAVCDGVRTDEELEVAESQAAPKGEEALQLAILRVLNQNPGLDDVEIADSLGAVPFEVSRLLRQLEKDGLVERAS